MSKSFKAGLLAATAATLLCSPTLASAALVDSALPAHAAAAPNASALAALDFLTQAVADTAAAAAEPAADSLATAADQRAYKSGVGQLIPPPAKLRGDVDLFLWNLLGIVHAQREGKSFELADRGIAFVLAHHGDQPSAVPLPGALWLFVMGLLGLAGTRITGAGGGAGVQRQRTPAPAMGPAVAA